MSRITTHILDTSLGQPAGNVLVELFTHLNNEWTKIGYGHTDVDGRLPGLLDGNQPVNAGIYKLRFNTKEYFKSKGVQTFYPFVEIVFDIDSTGHYHVPLLLNPYGYTTYRGS